MEETDLVFILHLSSFGDNVNRMGQSNSRNIPASGFLFEVSKAVCKIIVQERDGEKSTATGFLAKFSSRGGVVVHGLFTNHHVLGSSRLADNNQITVQFDGIQVGWRHRPFAVSLCTTGLFRFTCSVLDATFVRFDQAAMQKFKGCQYLTIEHQKVLSKGEPVILFQHPIAKGKDGVNFGQLAEGSFIEYHGMDFFLSTSTDHGSLSGSPIALSDGTVIGIHKENQNSSSNRNIAVTMTAVIRALLPFFVVPTSLPSHLISNPVVLGQQYNCKVLEIGLGVVGHNIAGLDLMYVRPASAFVSAMLAVPLTTPMWFVPTSHGWYWTPTDPSHSTEETNWMPVSQLTIVGGFLQDWIPEDTSATIIHWLSQHNIFCGICPKV